LNRSELFVHYGLISNQIWRTIRISPILLAAAFILLNVNVDSQKISINRAKATLEEILLDINKQTGYSYSVTNSLLKDFRPIDIHVTNGSLTEVLEICINEQSITYSIRDSIIILKSKNRLFSVGDRKIITPYNFNNITILNDSAARSIYGTRDGNLVPLKTN
jgi:hypothetical protein